MAAKKRDLSGDRTYLMRLKNGNLRRVTVPADWKVTFGPIIVQKKGGPRHYGNEEGWGWGVRFYEGTIQRAVFTDVESFRDESIKLQERVTKTQRRIVHKRTKDGMRDVAVEAQMHEWIDPFEPQDDSDNEFLPMIEGKDNE